MIGSCRRSWERVERCLKDQQPGRVDSSDVYGGNGRAFEPHDGFDVAYLGNAQFGTNSCWVALLMEETLSQQYWHLQNGYEYMFLRNREKIFS